MRVRHDPPQGARVEPPASDREKKGLSPIPHELGPRVAQIAREPPRGLLAERHDALLAALAAHANELLLEVDVREIEVDRLAAAEPRRVDELDQRAVAEGECTFALERVQRLLDLCALRRIGQPPRPAWAERGLRQAPRSQREAQERADRREAPRNRRRRELRASATELGGVLGELAYADVVELDRVPIEPIAEVREIDSI